MDFSLTTLYVLPNGTLAADNFKREALKPTQFGIFNSRYKAVTTAGAAFASPYIVFGQGRIENVPGLTHKYSDKVSSGSLIEWYKVTGSPTSKNQITYAGFDGVDNTKTIKAGCDEQFSLTVRARSLYIDTAFAYGLTRTVTVTTPCCVDCGDDCATVDPRYVANAFAEKINAEPLLSKFVVATPVFECTTPGSDPTTVATITYSLSFCDNGDAAALAAVQVAYVDAEVTRTARLGSISTYSLTLLGSDPSPAAFVVTQPVTLAICDVCPTGYTLQGAGERYLINVPIDPSTDLSTSGARQTFANTVKAAYVAPKVFNGATDVDPTTNQITITAHGLVVGTPVVYSNGGGTTIVGLTNGATYYIESVPDANNVTLAATKGGAVVDITADGAGAAHSLTLQSSATFVSNDGGSATVLVTVDDSAATFAALTSNTVTQLESVEAECIPPAGTSVSWVATGAGFKAQRTLSLTITDDCTSDLAAVQAQYPSYTVTLVESANCNSQYNLVQTSETVEETCNFSVPPVYTDIQEYKGIAWTVVPTVLDGSGCVAGVKIEGKSLDKYGNPCDPIDFPFEFDKLTFEVFAYKGAATSQDFLTFDRCDNIPITTTQRSTFPTGSGDEIYELEKRYHSYQTTLKHIYHLSAYNGGFIRYSDPSIWYDTYYLKFKSPDLNTWDNVSRQDESVIFAVPQGQGTALEAFLIGYFGVEKFTAGVLTV